MKKLMPLLLALTLLVLAGQAQTIVNAEYFFDKDPGVGNGTAISISSPEDSIDVATTISVSALTPGFHNLFIRTQNADGLWSLYEGRNFYIQPTPVLPPAKQLLAAEYFFDKDPGVGKGTAVTGIIADDSINVSSSVSTTSLAPGFHNLFIRVKDTNDVWSLYEGRNFYVQATPANPPSLLVSAAEYFFDKDPGIGKGTAISGITAADSIATSAAISLNSLTPGFHQLFIRTRNVDNKWSLYEGRHFFIQPPTAVKKSAPINAAEYFFDKDPGVGKGLPIHGITMSDSVHIVRNLDASMLSLGVHKAFVRVRDTAGIWSLYDGGKITVKFCTIGAVASHNNLLCNGATNGTATIIPSGGDTPYTYSWSNGKTTATISNVPAGMYVYTVKDTAGCSASDTVKITQPPAFNIVKTKTNTSCGLNNGVLGVTVTGATEPYNYSWNNGIIASTATVSGLAPGGYTVTITDDLGCTTTSVNSITPSIPISVSVTKTNSTCLMADGSATATGSNGKPPYAYKWSTGDTLATASNLPSGIYVVTATDSLGCSNFTIATISDVGSANIATTKITNVSLSCNTPNGAIDISVSGAASPYTYSWSTGATSQDIAQLQAGPYEVFVKDKDGCISNKSIIVGTSPTITYNISVNNANCGSSDGFASVSAAGGNSPYTYSWSTGKTTANATGLMAGLYNVTITDASGCKATGVASVSSIGSANIAINSVSEADCYEGIGAAINVTITGGASPYTYSWSNGATTEDLANVSQGTYNLTVTGSNNCVSVATTTVTPIAPPSPAICMVSVDSTNHNVVIWDKLSGKRIKGYNIYKESTQSGVYQKIAYVPYDELSWYTDPISNASKRSFRYKISIVDSCDNESEKSSEHKTMHLTTNKGIGNKINLIWDNYQGFPFGSYIVNKGYDPDNLFPIDTVPNTIFTYTDTTIADPVYYVMEVVSPNTCIPTAKSYFESRSNTAKQSLIIGINETEVQNSNVWIYPNPTNGTFNLQVMINEKQSFVIRLFNATGQLILTENTGLITGMLNKSIDIHQHPKGVYYLQLISNQGIIQRKIVVQ